MADRVFEVLSNPAQIKKPVGPPAFNISGQWDLEMKFTASTVNQTLVLGQKDNDLTGIHIGSICSRDLEGTIYDKDILIRSSYKMEGVRINFELKGTVYGDTMDGQANLCEYGMAEWKARRHTYGK